MAEHEQDDHDVVVIGSGAAGLSGALVLARSRRSVVVVDGGQPRNAPAAGVHGFLTRDGMPPAELLRTAREEVRGYGGVVLEGRVEQVQGGEDGRFAVLLAGGRRLGARRLLVATGLVDELPDVPGLPERWGRDVLHCPYCHGWEVRDQPVARAGVRADVGAPGADVPPADRRRHLPLARAAAHRGAGGAAPGARHRPGARPVAGLEVQRDRLTGVRLAGGSTVACTALVVATTMRARAGFLGGLGLVPVAHPSGVAEHLVTDGQGRTAVDGVWAAGNVTDPMAQVGASAAAGAAAAAQINGDLVAEDTRRAVEARRAELGLVGAPGSAR